MGAAAQCATTVTVAHRLSWALRRSVPQQSLRHTVYHGRYGAVCHSIHRGAPSFFCLRAAKARGGGPVRQRTGSPED
eukprot:7350536-Alexandrium_andersonii.AAC.1